MDKIIRKILQAVQIDPTLKNMRVCKFLLAFVLITLSVWIYLGSSNPGSSYGNYNEMRELYPDSFQR